MFLHAAVDPVELLKESCSCDLECRGALLAHQQASSDVIAFKSLDQSAFPKLIRRLPEPRHSAINEDFADTSPKYFRFKRSRFR